MLRFESDSHEDFVEIHLVDQEADELPSKGDAYLSIQVSSAGFSGHNDLWIDGATMHSFCKGLVGLERERRGEAIIKSISPEELSLSVHSVGRRGHMAIEGSTGYQVQREDFLPWHSVQFGFQFDPSQLVSAIRLDWIKRYSE